MVKPSTLSMQLRPGLKSEAILEVFESEGYRDLVNLSLIKQGVKNLMYHLVVGLLMLKLIVARRY
jgi:hypothetical protein